MTIPLNPCPLCGSDQVQVCTDANNPSKDYCRCRECKCTAPLVHWNKPHDEVEDASPAVLKAQIRFYKKLAERFMKEDQ